MLPIKLIVFAAIGIGAVAYNTQMTDVRSITDTKESMKQFDQSVDQADLRLKLNADQRQSGYQYIVIYGGLALLGVIFFANDVARFFKKARPAALIVCLSVPFLGGCFRKPFEPVKLEVIKHNEEAFLIPYVGNTKDQASTHSEDFLRESLVQTQQVKIPQQWHQLGYDSTGWNGEWKDAAELIRVDRSPVTREWTADPATGTSTKNEAVWVMTADQVEFSTGWTCTARIANRDDAVKFLYNYPNGALVVVMDGELRGKLQAVFGLEVTDLPMEELRKRATPHITNTVKEVTTFFKDRGITITNLGITGGFIYRNQAIMDKLVEVFNAEQKEAIARSGTKAQEETNKQLLLAATGKASALMAEKEMEAKAIKLVADAKAYEIEKAMADPELSILLRSLELKKAELTQWDGHYPTFYMGGAGNAPISMLMPAPDLSKLADRPKQPKKAPTDPVKKQGSASNSRSDG